MSIEQYKDMIYMERPVSKKHTPMPLENRAAQFAPFAALVGYDEAVEETSRLTTNKIELSGEMKAELDLTLSRIQYLLDTTTDRDNTPEVAITYFVKDVYKEGGEYVTISSRIRRIDPVDRVIVLQDKSTIPIDDVLQLKF